MNWSLKQRILRHVRIHGGDSNALARAMHCGVQKDTLMTNEKGLFAQADLRNVRGSTIERKIMSTKTTTKRISLVVAAALAFGGFSAVSAHAAYTQNPATLPFIKDTTTVNVAAAGAVSLATGQSGVTYTKGVLANSVTGITAPAGSVISFKVISSGGGTWAAGSTGRVALNGTNTYALACSTIATITCTLANFTVPSTAGTYNTVIDMSGTDTGAASYASSDELVALTLTVTAAPGYTAGASTVYANDLVADASSTTDGTIYGIKTLNTQGGNITVTVKNSDGSVCTACLVGGYITGAGYLEEDTNTTGAFGDVTGGTKVRSLTALAPKSSTGVASIGVYGDGTQGTGVITITVTDAAGNVTTLGTKNVVFYGAVASLKLVKQPYTVLKAGGATSGIKTALVSAATTTLLTSPAFVVEALDSAGNPVGGLSASLSAVSSDSTQVGSASNNEDVVTTIDPNSTWGGPGFYVFDATSASSSTSGGKGTLTIKILNPADTTNSTYLTTTVNFSIGGVVAKEVISTDAASYAPGAVMTVTITATDSKGNPAYDGAASPALTFSKAVGGSYAASVYAAGKRANSANTLFAPSVAGPFLITGTGTDVNATAITANATVSSVNDAQIASLITKINALAALIAKIQKKLGVK